MSNAFPVQNGMRQECSYHHCFDIHYQEGNVNWVEI